MARNRRKPADGSQRCEKVAEPRDDNALLPHEDVVEVVEEDVEDDTSMEDGVCVCVCVFDCGCVRRGSRSFVPSLLFVWVWWFALVGTILTYALLFMQKCHRPRIL